MSQEQHSINPPLISIIIATYNASYLLEKAISSITCQSYENYEIIVVDASSTDDTISYVNRNRNAIDKFISEPDKGIFDAWNKGIKLSNGDWISFLGAGDEYTSHALENYVNYIKSYETELEFVSSKIDIVDEKGNILMTKGSKWEWPKFLQFMNTPHVGALHSRKFLEKYGEFDISYKVAGDYEFLMRPRNTLKAGFLDEITVKMLFGGISVTSLKDMHEGFRVKTETGKMPIWLAKIDYYVAMFKATIRAYFFKKGLYFTLRR